MIYIDRTTGGGLPLRSDGFEDSWKNATIAVRSNRDRTAIERRSCSFSAESVDRFVPLHQAVIGGTSTVRSTPNRDAIVARSPRDRGLIAPRSWPDRPVIVARSPRDRGEIAPRSGLICHEIEATIVNNRSSRSHD